MTTTISSVTNVKNLHQVTDLQLANSLDKITTALVLCNTACAPRNSCVSTILANTLGLHSKALKLTFKSINNNEVDSKLV